MGLALEMTSHIRKIVIISIRTCYRSVRKYPFFVSLLCFLILLYRSCPFLFSLLVSASPVLICTAALLGTLLSFGELNIPEIETEEKVSCDVAFFRSGILKNATAVAAEDGNFPIERIVGNKVQDCFVETSSVEDGKASKLEDRGGLDDFPPSICKSDCEIQFDEGEVQKEADRELYSSEFESGRKVYEENLDTTNLDTDGKIAIENQYFMVQSTRNVNLEEENFDIPIVPVHGGDHVHSSPNDNDEHDYDSSDSGSDRAESSSPDASMADIIPMLDELHPLLDSEAPLPIDRSSEKSDASSEESHKSDGECVMSDDEVVDHREESGAIYNDDDDEDDDDEGMQEEKEDDSKSAIKWTEDDQKNLMDLGTLELERNQRLENLIARRRVRNNLRMLAGKNLIDLDGFDLPANVAPISTARRNPFDLPYDSYDNMGLPPIPGSAPSILLPRRNPFDLPYDPAEEKPDLKGDGFEQEFLTSQQKDLFFRRHESFSQGSSSFAVLKQEQQNMRWKPYFIMPEKVASEGTSYSPLERQLSEVSETNLSSVSDTESMSSIADENDKKPDESQSYLETAAVSYLDHATNRIECGNGSWEDLKSEEFVQVESRDVHHEVIQITLRSVESHVESISRSSEIGTADTSMELNASEVHPQNEGAETDYSSNSSLSSLSEVSEKPFEIKTDELKPDSPCIKESGTSMQPSPGDADFKISLELHASEIHPRSIVAETDYNSNSSSSLLSEAREEPFELMIDEVKQRSFHIEESGIAIQPSVEDSNSRIASEVLDDNQHGPVYDSSPSAEGKLFFSPCSSDIHAEITNRCPLLLAEIPTQDLHDMAGTTNSHEYLAASDASFPRPQEQNSPALGEQVVRISSSIAFPSSELELVEDGSKNEKEVGMSRQDFVQSIPSSELEPVEECIASSRSRDHNATPEVITSVTESEQAWLDKPMVESVLNICEDAGETDTLPTNFAVEINSENTTPEVHQDISAGISSVAFDSTSISLESSEFNSPNIGGDPLDDIVDEVIYEDREAISKQLDSLAEAYEYHFSENTMKEEVDEMADIDEELLSELDEVGDFKVKELGEPAIEKIIPEEAQTERTDLDSLATNSYLTETKLELPILEARSIDDIHLDFRQLNEGVDVEEVIIPGVVVNQVEVEAKVETNSNLEVVEARSIDDINLAFRQLHEGVEVEEVILPDAVTNQVEEEAKVETNLDLEVGEARLIDDINLAFRQLHEGVDVEEVILLGAVTNLVEEEAKVETNSDLIVEERQGKIDEIRKMVGPIADKFPVLCSNASILRYLRARNWNTKKAFKMLKETLKWRLEYKPEKISWEDIAHEAKTGKIYRANYTDKQGRTVLIMRPNCQNTDSASGHIRYLVYCMENAILNLNSNDGFLVWLIDFHGWNTSSISMKVTREIAHVLQNHYPERLGLAILYDPPKEFESFWMVVKPFMESKTFNKVRFVYSNNPESQKIVEENFDKEKLEISFGGKNSAGFDYEAYGQSMMEDDKKMSDFIDSGRSSPTYGSVLSISQALDSVASELCSEDEDADETASNFEVEEKKQEMDSSKPA